ncbi:MAG: hypothetical protein IPJ18_20235 [Betaproteobacteria bacterium]|nr:hypothetical protein [Betaproteobacteria bacterium]
MPSKGFDANLFKSMVSGDALPIDRKYLSPISYAPQAHWILCTNHDQKSADNTLGFWRRMAIVPFTHQVAEADVIPGLDRKIIASELNLFLDWCLVGLQRLLARGKLPEEPTAIQEAKKQAELASDTVKAWIEEDGVKVVTPSALTGTRPAFPRELRKDDVFKRYVDWCVKGRLRPLACQAF